MEELKSQTDDPKADASLLRQRLTDYSQWNRSVFTASIASVLVTSIGPQLVADCRTLIALPLLIVVWSLFCVAIVFSLLSSVTTRRAIRTIDLETDIATNEGSYDEPPANIAAGLNILLGLITSATFLAAVICFVVFMGVNLQNGVNESSRSNLETSELFRPSQERLGGNSIQANLCYDGQDASTFDSP